MFPAAACPTVCAKPGNTHSCTSASLLPCPYTAALLQACAVAFIYVYIYLSIYIRPQASMKAFTSESRQSPTHTPALNVSLHFFLFWTCSYIVFHALVVLLLLKLCCRKKEEGNFILILISLPNYNKIIRNTLWAAKCSMESTLILLTGACQSTLQTPHHPAAKSATQCVLSFQGNQKGPGGSQHLHCVPVFRWSPKR